ncbi:MAG: hypothetical protein GX491_07175 [Chloroflexi bacterium]|nr:hypothetical protein [Chloroflexota bacterium]
MSENPSGRTSSIQGWIGGAILILIGVIFLARNLTGFSLENWWALFILIPAVGAFSRAYSIYQEHGRLTAEARGSMIGGFAMTMVAVIFLFNLNFGTLWPLFLILGGVTLLINALLP